MCVCVCFALFGYCAARWSVHDQQASALVGDVIAVVVVYT